MSFSLNELPQPGPDALNHSQKLTERIADRIADTSGVISFDDFMRMALYEPGLGYYSAGASKLGESGDFITAPEISPVFSLCLSRQCAEILRSLAEPIVLELGAGSGLMAAEILQDLKALNTLPEKYFILEPSADLRERQQVLLKSRVPEMMDRIEWLDSLPPMTFKGVILANEVLDAMPVKRFHLSAAEIFESGVSHNNGSFDWKLMEAGAALKESVEQIRRQSAETFPETYTSELNQALPSWISSLSACLKEGIILLIDYGYPRHEYYHEQRSMGTLLCHYRHRAHDNPFCYIGLQDITSSVEFTAVAEAAVASDLKIKGFTSQAYFLLGCGLEAISFELTEKGKMTRLEAAQQIRTLTMPGEMGEKFKVMALGQNYDRPLCGFSIIDQRKRL